MRGSNSGTGMGLVNSSKLPERSWGPSMDTVVVSTEIKRSGREAYHTPSYGAEVTNMWSYTSTPPLCLHGVYTDTFPFLHFFFFAEHKTTQH